MTRRTELDLDELQRVAEAAAAKRKRGTTERQLFESLYDARRAFVMQPTAKRAALLAAVRNYERYLSGERQGTTR